MATYDPDAYLGSLIFDALYERLSGDLNNRFAKFVRDHPTDRWLIFSDYVLGDPKRPNDVFAYTVLPGGPYFEGLQRDFTEIARKR